LSSIVGERKRGEGEGIHGCWGEGYAGPLGIVYERHFWQGKKGWGPKQKHRVCVLFGAEKKEGSSDNEEEKERDIEGGRTSKKEGTQKKPNRTGTLPRQKVKKSR